MVSTSRQTFDSRLVAFPCCTPSIAFASFVIESATRKLTRSSPPPRDPAFKLTALYRRSVCTCCTPDISPPRTRQTGSIAASRGGTASSSRAFSSRSRSPARNAARSPSRSTRISGKFQQTTLHPLYPCFLRGRRRQPYAMTRANVRGVESNFFFFFFFQMRLYLVEMRQLSISMWNASSQNLY